MLHKGCSGCTKVAHVAQKLHGITQQFTHGCTWFKYDIKQNCIKLTEVSLRLHIGSHAMYQGVAHSCDLSELLDYRTQFSIN